MATLFLCEHFQIRVQSVVAYTDISDKELHRQVGVGRVVTSGSLGGVMVCTLVWNARDVGSTPALDFSSTPTIMVAMTMILYKLCAILLNLPWVGICKIPACM